MDADGPATCALRQRVPGGAGQPQPLARHRCQSGNRWPEASGLGVLTLITRRLAAMVTLAARCSASANAQVIAVPAVWWARPDSYIRTGFHPALHSACAIGACGGYGAGLRCHSAAAKHR